METGVHSDERGEGVTWMWIRQRDFGDHRECGTMLAAGPVQQRVRRVAAADCAVRNGTLYLAEVHTAVCGQGEVFGEPILPGPLVPCLSVMSCHVILVALPRPRFGSGRVRGRTRRRRRRMPWTRQRRVSPTGRWVGMAWRDIDGPVEVMMGSSWGRRDAKF